MSPTVSELERLANDKPSEAFDRADRLAARAADPHVRAGWLRVKGLSALLLGRSEEAERILEDARIDAAGDDDVLGRVETTLGIVVAWRGDGERGLAILDGAVGRLDGVARARAVGQRGTVLNRLGRRAEAMEAFETALGLLPDDDHFKSLVLNNRAILLIEDGRAAAGVADLERAVELRRRLDQASALAEATHNLGWASHLVGDLAGALTHFDRAESMFSELGSPMGEPLRDRARALLDAGLIHEATSYARRASELLSAGEMEVPLAESLVVLARTQLLAGDGEAAAGSARRALDMFRSQGRPGWAATAEMLLLQISDREADRSRPVDVDRLRRLIERLDDGGLSEEAADARLIAGRRALGGAHDETARRWLDEVGGSGGFQARVRRCVARALLARSAGDHAAAGRSAAAGLAALDRWRSTMATVEMRTALSVHATDLSEVGVGHAVATGRPRPIFEWVERSRAASLRQVPVRPPDDPGLVDELAELRLAQGRLERAERDGSVPDGLRRRVTNAEEAVRRRIRRTPTDGTRRPPIGAAETLERLGTATLTQLSVVDGRLLAVTLGDGRARLVELGQVGPVLDLARRSSLRLRSAADPHRSEASRVAATRSILSDVDELWDALGPAMGGDGPLVVVPPADLAAFPWGLLQALRERPLVVAPSATIWAAASDPAPSPRGDVVAVAGPDLDLAAREIDVVSRSHPMVSDLQGEAATCAAVLAALGAAHLAHVVCHGRFRLDSPMFSTLEMADGGLSLYELERSERMPATLVLSACDLGMARSERGDESLGVATGLLSAGASTVVVNPAAVPDSSATAEFMMHLHQELSAGGGPAESTAAARSRLDLHDPEHMAVAAFVPIGAG